MTIYFLIPAILILVTIVFLYYPKLPKRSYLAVAAIPLFMISSLRSERMGADYHVYVQMFNSLKNGGTSYMEKGFVGLNRIVSTFTDNYIGLAIVVNIIIFIPIIIYFYRRVEKKYWPVCMMVFALNPYMFIQTTFNAIRQGCAIGIIIIGFLLLIEKKGIKGIILFVIFVAIAAQFHKIAWVAIILIPVVVVNWKAAHWRIIAVICLVLNVIGVSGLLQRITGMLGSFIIYYNYEESLLNRPVYVIFIFIFIILLTYKYEGFFHTNEEKQVIDIYIFSLCFLLIAVTNDMVYRTYILFAILALAAVPLIWERFSEKKLRIHFKQENALIKSGYFIYYLGFYSFYLGYLWLTDNTNYVPFLFFFQ